MRSRPLQGVMGRLYETAVVLLLLTTLVLGMVWVASALLHRRSATESLYGESAPGSPSLLFLSSVYPRACPSVCVSAGEADVGPGDRRVCLF